MVDSDLVALLDSEARRMNTPDFIADDPVQFPRRFTRQQDIEIAGLIIASIAWGNRRMICRDAEKILGLMGNEPYAYTMERGFEELDPSMNLHRTFFARNLQQFLRGLNEIYSRCSTLDEFCSKSVARDDPAPAWTLVEKMQRVFADANGGCVPDRCLPKDLKHTALKRVNMALRWFVRDDGIVDMGIWKSIPKSKLYIPLDVHVGNVARDLGLLARKADDRKSVEMLTDTLRSVRPDDPVYYDYALFGIGVTAKQKL